jgi:hypothetical protein
MGRGIASSEQQTTPDIRYKQLASVPCFMLSSGQP